MRTLHVFALTLSFCTGRAGLAQCSEWTTGFESPGVDRSVSAAVAFDDGSGPALYVGGNFDSAGGLPANRVARWDGSTWSALGGGLGTSTFDDVLDMVVFDDGGGPAVFAGGDFRVPGGPNYTLAKWDGANWTPIPGSPGSNTSVEALAVHDDGSGPALYVGGRFYFVNGFAADRIARWDGSTWSTVGTGFGANNGNTVFSLEVYDDGNGPKLYAGGCFQTVAGLTVQSIAVWDGTSWGAVGQGLSCDVDSLRVFDDGSGPALYAGGRFKAAFGAAGTQFAKWDGTSWTDLCPAGDCGTIDTLAVFDDGTGAALFANALTTIGGVTVNGVARWESPGWSALGGGLVRATGSSGVSRALASYDDGGGAALFVGGDFELVGGQPAQNCGLFDGASWSVLGEGEGFVTGPVRALERHDDGSGAKLYATGAFSVAGGFASGNVGAFDGTRWHALGGGIESQGGHTSFESNALASFGGDLYVGGFFNTANQPGGNTLGLFNIGGWDGTSWFNVGGGLTFGGQTVHAMETFDDGAGEALFVGGEFVRAGGQVVTRIARWDGSAWGDLAGGVNAPVRALRTFDDGSGAQLYAAGDFTLAGGVPVNLVARWDGTSWTDAGAGLPARLARLAVFDDGSGSALFGAGVPAGPNRIWRLGATGWVPIDGVGTDDTVSALEVHDDGSGNGPALYAGGSFSSVAGVAADHLARWDGTVWTAPASTPDKAVLALRTYDDGSAPFAPLYAGGNFLFAGSQPSAHLGRWSNPCACEGSPYCTAGTTGAGCSALISSTGAASLSSPTGFAVDVAGLEGQKDGTMYFSTHGSQANPWGNGSSYQCVVPPVTRTGVLQGVGTFGACDGAFQLDFNAWMTANRAKAPQAGSAVSLQCWFRDPTSTSNQSTSLSNALRFSVCP